jgi:hypothetical protein
MYAVGAVVLFVSLTITHFHPLYIGCCAKVVFDGVYILFLVLYVMQHSVGIFVLGWSVHVNVSPP